MGHGDENNSLTHVKEMTEVSKASSVSSGSRLHFTHQAAKAHSERIFSETVNNGRGRVETQVI